MITYNHALYINDAIEGILNQIISFEIELIICDDSSNNYSEEIIMRIKNEHPCGYLISYERNYMNLGMMKNFEKALKKCQGEYVAICEGDDYWIDKNKLQRQVSFMELNPDYSLVAENSIIKNEMIQYESIFSSIGISRDYSIMDLIKSRKFHTASVLIRNPKQLIPDNFSLFAFGDTTLFVLMAKSGKIRFQNEISSVYRKNDGGITSKPKIEWAALVERNNLMLKDVLDTEYENEFLKNIKEIYYFCVRYYSKRLAIKGTLISLSKFLQYYSLTKLNKFGKINKSIK